MSKKLRGWWAVSDLDADDTTPFAYFVALGDAQPFWEKCKEDNPAHRFALVEL